MTKQIFFTAAVMVLLSALPSCQSNNNDDMKILTVKKVVMADKTPSIQQVKEMFGREDVQFNDIDVVNWPEYSYKPVVKFRIAHSDEEIYLQYVVKEEGARGTYDFDGDGALPYTDDCVEFFMIPSDKDSIYYNLEFNCIGHGTFAGGEGRSERTRFDAAYLAQIRRESTLGSEVIGQIEGPVEWTLTLAIPKAIYSLSDFSPLSGRSVRANFYKCGDSTAVKHFLSWNPIEIDKPNFHRPDFFGEIYFE